MMFRRHRKQDDFDSEIESHIRMEIDRLLESGLSEEEAQIAARRAFGNITHAQEGFYESRRWLWGDALWRDLRFGARMLVKNPGYTALAVLTLGLAIGINTAIFSVLNAALLKSLPAHKPNELVMLTDSNASMILGGTQTGVRRLLTYPEFVALRNESKTLSGLCASEMPLERWPVHIADGAQEQASGRLVSENYFSVFGISPAIGRFFTQQDATGIDKDPYAVISYDYWQQRFGGNPAVIGTPIRIYKTTLVVVGVAAKGFRGETVGQDPDVWLPILMQPLVHPGMDGLHDTMDHSRDKLMWLHTFGRRKPGATLAEIQAEMNVLFHGILEAGYPTTMPAQDRKHALSQQIVVRPVGTGAFHGRQQFSEEWTILLALAGLVLLIACANVANLLLARAMTRSREVAIRLSIGAAREHLIRQFLTESLLLASVSGIAGIFVAVAASRALPLLLSDANPAFQLATGLDWQVLRFTVCITIFTGILFGLAPALRATSAGFNENLKEIGRTAGRSRQRATFGRTLVIAQLALSLLLVIGAVLFLQTLGNLQIVALGYQQGNLLLADVDTSGSGYTGTRKLQLLDSIRQRIQAVSGVRAATWSDRGLFGKFGGAFPITVEGFTSNNDDDKGSTGDSVGPRYFSTVGIPLLLGREITAQDAANSPRACVINEAFAKHFFARRNPIGKHIASIFFNDNGKNMRRLPMQVIGVAKDARTTSLRGEIEPKFYAASEQAGALSSVTFEIRTDGDPHRLTNAIRKTILQINGDLQIRNERTLREILNEQNARPRLIARLCTIFGAFALVLAAIGIYGILSFNVARRTNEIGIRMALGAQKRNIVGLIVRETSATIALGVIVGIAAAAISAQLLAVQLYGGNPTGPRWSLAHYEHVNNATQLYGVSAMDPLTIAIAIGLLVLVALTAAYLPAARAARIEPTIALRHE